MIGVLIGWLIEVWVGLVIIVFVVVLMVIVLVFVFDCKVFCGVI